MRHGSREFPGRVACLCRKATLIGTVAVSFFFVGLAFGQIEVPGKPTDMADKNYAAKLHIHNGLTAMAQGLNDYAKGEFEFVIHRPFDNYYRSVAYLNLGVISFMEDRPDQAIKYYESALQLTPDYPEAYFNMGAAYYKQENLRKAEETFLKAIELQPGYGRAHYSLGFVYLDQQKYDLAGKHAEKAEQYGVSYKSLKDKLAKVTGRRGK
jgi:tetratricopeptide (TPR) repeat protein